jgi:uncharacterized protein
MAGIEAITTLFDFFVMLTSWKLSA